MNAYVRRMLALIITLALGLESNALFAQEVIRENMAGAGVAPASRVSSPPKIKIMYGPSYPGPLVSFAVTDEPACACNFSQCYAIDPTTQDERSDDLNRIRNCLLKEFKGKCKHSTSTQYQKNYLELLRELLIINYARLMAVERGEWESFYHGGHEVDNSDANSEEGESEDHGTYAEYQYYVKSYIDLNNKIELFQSNGQTFWPDGDLPEEKFYLAAKISPASVMLDDRIYRKTDVGASEEGAAEQVTLNLMELSSVGVANSKILSSFEIFAANALDANFSAQETASPETRKATLGVGAPGYVEESRPVKSTDGYDQFLSFTSTTVAQEHAAQYERGPGPVNWVKEMADFSIDLWSNENIFAPMDSISDFMRSVNLAQFPDMNAVKLFVERHHLNQKVMCSKLNEKDDELSVDYLDRKDFAECLEEKYFADDNWEAEERTLEIKREMLFRVFKSLYLQRQTALHTAMERVKSFKFDDKFVSLHDSFKGLTQDFSFQNVAEFFSKFFDNKDLQQFVIFAYDEASMLAQLPDEEQRIEMPVELQKKFKEVYVELRNKFDDVELVAGLALLPMFMLVGLIPSIFIASFYFFTAYQAGSHIIENYIDKQIAEHDMRAALQVVGELGNPYSASSEVILKELRERHPYLTLMELAFLFNMNRMTYHAFRGAYYGLKDLGKVTSTLGIWRGTAYTLGHRPDALSSLHDAVHLLTPQKRFMMHSRQATLQEAQNMMASLNDDFAKMVTQYIHQPQEFKPLIKEILQRAMQSNPQGHLLPTAKYLHSEHLIRADELAVIENFVQHQNTARPVNKVAGWMKRQWTKIFPSEEAAVTEEEVRQIFVNAFRKVKVKVRVDGGYKQINFWSDLSSAKELQTLLANENAANLFDALMANAVGPWREIPYLVTVVGTGKNVGRHAHWPGAWNLTKINALKGLCAARREIRQVQCIMQELHLDGEELINYMLQKRGGPKAGDYIARIELRLPSTRKAFAREFNESFLDNGALKEGQKALLGLEKVGASNAGQVMKNRAFWNSLSPAQRQQFFNRLSERIDRMAEKIPGIKKLYVKNTQGQVVKRYVREITSSEGSKFQYIFGDRTTPITSLNSTL